MAFITRLILSLCFITCSCCFATPAEERLAEHIHYSESAPNKVGHILINDRESGITGGTWIYVKKALEYYKEQKPIFIILELNTPGGEVYAAQTISDALKDLDIQNNIPVVCFINNWAISAGAMIAYSSRFIAVTTDASMGAAEPMTLDSAGEGKQASEKVNSALRSDMANRARFFNRNPLIAEAMVDKDIILVLRNNEFVKLDNDKDIKPTDTIISAKGKLLTLDSEQLMKYGVADVLVPPVKLETLTTKSALFATPFFKNIPHAVLDEYIPDWKTKFFIFLSHPIVSSALFMGMVLGFYMEMNMPGTTLPGTVALICLFLIILSNFSMELGNYLELILLGTGLLILAVELFVLPTFGLLGIVGIITFLIGLFGLMLPGWQNINFDFDTQTVNGVSDAFFHKLTILGVTFILAIAVMALLSRYVFPNFAGFNRFVLKGNEQTGYLAVDNPKTLPPVGKEGTVFATLRPAGKVVIDGKIYDAISKGGFIEKNEAVKVIGFEGGSIVVNSKIEGQIS